MQTIFGLDLGVASIGWAVIKQNPTEETQNELLDCGVRTVPLSTDEIKEFGKGGSVPTNVARRMARGARRNLQRFRLRRHLLYRALTHLNMLPDAQLLNALTPLQLYQLRAKALSEALTLPEIGRILLHLNLRRGYKSSRKDQTESDGKKQSDYLKEIAAREASLREKQMTIGAQFAAQFKENPRYRVKQQIFNRDTYMEEFDLIWSVQAQFHPDVLTETNRRLLRDKVIYRQRPLRSQKNLVGECALEWNYALDKITHEPIIQPNGLKKIVRPKAAPKSSPLAQECKVWESLHNLRVYDNKGIAYPLSQAEKEKLFDILQQEEKNLSATKIIKTLGLSPSHYKLDKLIAEKGLETNRTRAKLLSILKNRGRDLLKFDPETESVPFIVPETGEQIQRLQLKSNFDREPLYELWHLIYATEEQKDLVRILLERYDISEDQAEQLAELDFTKEGYASKSHRAMRRLLPHYRNGKDYTEACKASGYNHSNSITLAENEARDLLDKLDIIPKNTLRNPVVEKILNQLIHVVNDLMAAYGRPDVIRIELARELKQSAKERQGTDKRMRGRERENQQNRQKVAELLGIQPESVTKTQLEKYRLYEEIDGVSLYTGEKMDLAALLRGENVDIEHIIPKVRRFDDSYENKTICERKLNQDKNKYTALDFMEAQGAKGLQSFDAYLRRIKDLFDNNKISKGKYNRLLMSAEAVGNDTEFIARQLRETQYITRKARQLLLDICRNVNTTSGSITDFLRHQWGWDEVIEQLRLPQFREQELTEMKWIHKGQQQKEVIPGWDKRKDHRHHAIDALAIACTRQSHVQRLNTLNQALEGKFGNERREELLKEGRDKFIAGPPPFSHRIVQDAVENVLISFKQGNRVASPSKNKPKHSKKSAQISLTPRGQLHEETVYGRVKQYQKIALGTRFNPELLAHCVHPFQKELVEARLAAFGNDPKKAFKDLDKNPICYGAENQKHLTHITIWEYKLVSRKNISPLLTEKAAQRILDPKVKTAVQTRLGEHKNDPKQAFKDLATAPILVNGLPVHRVRIHNPAEKVIELPRGFVEPGSNHHIAIYLDENGKKQEHVATFWDAYQRRLIGLPAVITDPAAAYDYVAQYIGKVPESLNLPANPDWKFLTSLSGNDMFVFDLDPKEFDWFNPANRAKISKKLFRVRKLTSGNYWFLHHLETEILEDVPSKKAGRCRQASLSSMQGAVKVRLNRLGHIIHADAPIL